MRVSKFINVYEVRSKITCDAFFKFMIQYGCDLIIDDDKDIIYMPYSTLYNIVKTKFLSNKSWDDEMRALGNSLYRLYNCIYHTPDNIIGIQLKKVS